MRILCTICTELFDGTSDVSVVQCGHMFHGTCLTRWIAQNMSCPQCRNRVTHKSIIHKLFFNQADTHDGNIDVLDVNRLENDLESARIALGQNDCERNCLITEKGVMDNKFAELTENYKILESIHHQEIHNSKLLKKELNDYQHVKQDGINAKEEVKSLQGQLSKLQNVQAVINDCESDIDSTLRETTNVLELATWCCTYKRELSRKRVECRELAVALKKTKKDFELGRIESRDCLAALMASREKNSLLEVDIAGQDRVIINLQKRLETYSQAAAELPKSTAVYLGHHRLLHESPAPFITPVKKRKLLDSSLSIDLNESRNDLFASPIQQNHNNGVSIANSIGSHNCILTDRKLVELQPEEETEMKHITSNNSLPLQRCDTQENSLRNSSLFNLNILKKRQLGVAVSNTFRQGYNGFGGHETHISPRKRSSFISTIVKKPTIPASITKSSSTGSHRLPPLPFS